MAKWHRSRVGISGLAFLLATVPANGQSTPPFRIPTNGATMQAFLTRISYESNDRYYDATNTLQSPPGFLYHHGTDIAGKNSDIKDTDFVYACGPGKVVYVGYEPSAYGHFVAVYHGIINKLHVYSFYSHMGNGHDGTSFVVAKLGQDVVAGTMLGRQGNSGYIIAGPGRTGIHLDWEIRAIDHAITTGSGSLVWQNNHRFEMMAASPDFYTGATLAVGDRLTAYAYQIPAAQGTWHPDGTLLTDGTTTWLLENGVRRGIPSETIFSSYGFSWARQIEASNNELSCLKSDPVTLQDAAVRTLANYRGTAFLITDKGFRRAFLSPPVFEGLGFTGLADVPVVTYLPGKAADPASPSLTSPFSDGTLVRSEGGSTVWVISNGLRRSISPDTMMKLGYRSDDVIRLSSDIFDRIEVGAVIADSTMPRCVPGGVSSPAAPTNLGVIVR